MPDIEGLDRFEGAMFHSAQWDHDYDVTGKRVAVIGTGASAIQFVPGSRRRSSRCTSSSAPPRGSCPTPTGRSAARAPALPPFPGCCSGSSAAASTPAASCSCSASSSGRKLMRLVERLARRHMRRPDLRPELRGKVDAGLHDRLQAHPALEQVVSGAGPRERRARHRRRSREVREHSIVTGGGEEVEVDAIIFGTGFNVTDMPVAQLRPRPRRAHARRALGGQPEGAPRLDGPRVKKLDKCHEILIDAVAQQQRYKQDGQRSEGERVSERRG